MDAQSLVGRKLSNGQYLLRQLIALGGMGAVYLGEETSLKRLVAVKVLQPTLTDPSFAQRFDLEATTAAALDHPNIVKIYSRGSEGGLHFLVMQHLTGGSLQQRLAQAGRLPALDESVRMIGQVAGALDYAHRQGVIHRDIKTSNIMFDGHGNAILVDFGIAKLAEQALELTRTGMAVGTPTYMAPEQSLGIALTPAADQYALGVVAYILVTGRIPYEAPTPFAIQQKKLTEPLTPPQVYRAELPHALKDVLERVLAPQPEARYTTTTQFAQALSDATSGFPESPSQFFSFPIRSDAPRTPTPSASPSAPPDVGMTEVVATPPPARRSGGRLPLIAGVAVVALLGILGILFLSQGSSSSSTPTTALQVAAGGLTALPTDTPVPATPTLPATMTEAPIIPTATFIAALSPTPLPSATPTLTPSVTSTASPLPTSTHTATSTATATNTPTPTHTSSATATRTPIPTATATATFTPIPLQGRVEVTFIDEFDGAELSEGWWSWERRPTPRDGAVVIEGRDSWTDAIVRPDIVPGEGILVSFRYGGDFRGGITYEGGEYQTEDFRLLGITRWEFWQIGAEYDVEGTQRVTYSEPPLEPNVTYSVLYRITEDGVFQTRIWRQDAPTRYLVSNDVNAPSKDWATTTWELVLKVYSGTMTIESFQELRFSEDYVLPATPDFIIRSTAMRGDCLVQTANADVSVRVGPGLSRTIRAALLPDTQYRVTGRNMDNGEWWRLEWADAPAGEQDRYWVNAADVDESVACAAVSVVDSTSVIPLNPPIATAIIISGLQGSSGGSSDIGSSQGSGSTTTGSCQNSTACGDGGSGTGGGSTGGGGTGGGGTTGNSTVGN